jgi:deazaflavin-dependent oxidoreductase (nitroreductase family)
MVLPQWLARANRVGLNHVTRRVAGWMPGMGIVEHEGRRSGRAYRTPVNVFPAEAEGDGRDGYVLALTYGPDTDWVRNVVHAGRAVIHTRRHAVATVNPRIVHDPERQAIPSSSLRTILKLLDVDHFLLLDREPPPVPEVVRGRLCDPDEAPEDGERSDELVQVRNLVVEQILSGTVEPADYLQPQDEWVVVLAGAATLEVRGQPHALSAGDWLYLPAGTPHRLVQTQPGTSWLAVHLHPDRDRT